MQDKLPPGRLDAVYQALSHARRRCVLRALDGAVPPVSLETLTSEIVGMERTRADDSGLDWSSVSIDLHHHHLPYLEDACLINYDPVRGDVVAWAGGPSKTSHDSPSVNTLTGFFDEHPDESDAEPVG